MNARQLEALERRTRSLDPCPLCERGSGDGRMVGTVGLMLIGATTVALLWAGTTVLG